MRMFIHENGRDYEYLSYFDIFGRVLAASILAGFLPYVMTSIDLDSAYSVFADELYHVGLKGLLNVEPINYARAAGALVYTVGLVTLVKNTFAGRVPRTQGMG